MLSLRLGLSENRRPRILCLGAHSDDLEIGCGGTLMTLLKRHPGANVTWVVLSAAGKRAVEARRSAQALLRGAGSARIVLGKFPDGHFPGELSRLKVFLERVKRAGTPDLIFSHRLEDRHQDHRTVAELTWQTWRNHLILEYEIPKYEGDLGQPNAYVPLPTAIAALKIRHLVRHFATQRGRTWFHPQTFRALMRLRGLECVAESGYAEGHYVRKTVVAA